MTTPNSSPDPTFGIPMIHVVDNQTSKPVENLEKPSTIYRHPYGVNNYMQCSNVRFLSYAGDINGRADANRQFLLTCCCDCACVKSMLRCHWPWRPRTLAMPLFAFECPDCYTVAEILVSGTVAPFCPGCGSASLDKLPSAFAPVQGPGHRNSTVSRSETANCCRGQGGCSLN